MLGLGNSMVPSSSLAKGRSINFDSSSFLTHRTISDTNVFPCGGTSDWSCNFWIKFNTISTNENGIMKLGSGNEDVNFLIDAAAANPAATSKINFQYRFGGSLIIDLETSNINNSTLYDWSMFTFVMDRSDKFTIYVNGVNVGEQDISSFSSSNLVNMNDDPKLIGTALKGGVNYGGVFSITELAWWTEAFTNAQVKTIYNNGRPFDLRNNFASYTSTNLVDYYKFFGNSVDLTPYIIGITNTKVAYNFARNDRFFPFQNTLWQPDGSSTLKASHIFLLNSATAEDVVIDGEEVVKITRGTNDFVAAILYNASHYSPDISSDGNVNYHCFIDFKTTTAGSVTFTSAAGGTTSSINSLTTFRTAGWLNTNTNKGANAVLISGVSSSESPLFLKNFKVFRAADSITNALGLQPYEIEDSPSKNLG